MRVAVIGAGPAGLCTLKNCLDEGLKCDVFEKSGLIGGTWNYNEKTGLDEFGLPIHNSTYEDLRTNLPKELMQFENFPFIGPEKSYIRQPDVLKYIKDYANTFQLWPHVQFYKHVEEIDPLPKNRWKITTRDLKSIKQELEIKEYDAVVICVGNFNQPLIPNYKGLQTFKGTVDHSINYRTSERYKNKKVLVIGSGPSGPDIARKLSKVADEIILSHRSPLQTTIKFSDNVKIKPDVAEFQDMSVSFNDGTQECITDVLFCTGYIYSYPFLTKNCGIEAENKYVKYLYKQIINAEHPTMAFMGIPYVTYLFTLYGIQVRFFLAYLKGQFTVSKEEMIQDAKDYYKTRNEKGISLVKVEKGYYDDLSETAKIRNLPAVYDKLIQYIMNEGKEKFEETYKILNDEEFEII